MYKATIGIEIHLQLKTISKVYSSDYNKFGSMPNKNINEVSIGYPGTLPFVNKKVIEDAIKLGLACNCNIERLSRFSRKNYFYPDLPKGYQITQHNNPICKNGYLNIKIEDETKKIRINRIHIEEDTGKSIHDINAHNTLIDYNRAGVPLLEIVSEPDISSAEQASAYVSTIRRLARYIDISNSNMEEGSLRCDINISVSKNPKRLGTKVEVKNINSISSIKKAINYEILRQTQLIENNNKVTQETLFWKEVDSKTFKARDKENSNDYRYFDEPDIPPIIITEEQINTITKKMPQLPEKLYKKYTNELGLNGYDAQIIIESKDISKYFDTIIDNFKPLEDNLSKIKQAANWVIGPIKSNLNKNKISIKELNIEPIIISKIITLIDEKKINFSSATQKLFPYIIKNKNSQPLEAAKKIGILQDDKNIDIEKIISQTIEEFPNEFSNYKKGKLGLIGFFMGQIMKKVKGRVDPKTLNQTLKDNLDKR